MRHLLASVAFLCTAASFISCSKSGGTSQPVNPVDTTTPIPPTTTSYSYIYDSSFKATGSFATMGAIQPDGKIIIANTTQIARLNQDGTLDNSFATGSTENGEFHSLALQKDGKVILAGSFTSYKGQGLPYYLRLNTDGSVDNSFTRLPLTDFSSVSKADIKCIALQADGNILLGGNFFYPVSTVNGASTGPKQMIRLNANGSYDASFQHNVTANFVSCMRILADGKILVTGQFVSVEFFPTANTPDYRVKIVKLNADGPLDPSFRWSTTVFAMKAPHTALPAYGQDLAVQDDGKILLGGRFQTTSSVAIDDYTALIRLKADGSIDNTFPKRAFDGIVPSICLTSDRLIIGAMHDPDRAYQNASIAILQANKDGTDNANYKISNFTNYGDTYLVLEDANKNLLLFGKFYDKLGVPVISFHGVIRLKKL